MGAGRSYRRRRARQQRVVAVVLVLLAVVMVAAVLAPAAGAGTAPLAASITSADGAGRAVQPGRPCDDGGTGAYWHYEYGADLAPGVFSSLASEALVHLDLHSDLERFPNTDAPYPDGADPRAFLQGAESHASLLNDRGSVKLRLSSGTCDDPTLAFDGSNASGTGSWVVDGGTGAYRDIVGSGSFVLGAEVNPGGDNALDLDLAGSLTIPDPQLSVEVVGAFWGGLGTDYLSRRPTIVYRITNVGAGDAFGARVTAVTNPTDGVTPLVSTPIALGDLAAGESRDVPVRHQLDLLRPCNLVILGCDFETRISVELPDGFDIRRVTSVTVSASAPDLPPPL